MTPLDRVLTLLQMVSKRLYFKVIFWHFPKKEFNAYLLNIYKAMYEIPALFQHFSSSEITMFGENLTAGSTSRKGLFGYPIFVQPVHRRCPIPRQEQRRIKRAAGPFLFARLFHFVCLERVEGSLGEAARGSSHVHNVDYEQPLFFLQSVEQNARHANGHARDWLLRSRARPLLSLNLKKKRDCSQSIHNEDQVFYSNLNI